MRPMTMTEKDVLKEVREILARTREEALPILRALAQIK